jgi:hypothetical protein
MYGWRAKGAARTRRQTSVPVMVGIIQSSSRASGALSESANSSAK